MYAKQKKCPANLHVRNPFPVLSPRPFHYQSLRSVRVLALNSMCVSFNASLICRSLCLCVRGLAQSESESL